MLHFSAPSDDIWQVRISCGLCGATEAHDFPPEMMLPQASERAMVEFAGHGWRLAQTIPVERKKMTRTDRPTVSMEFGTRVDDVCPACAGRTDG